jgi:hypothetical protein
MAVPFPKTVNNPEAGPHLAPDKQMGWVGVAAAGTIVAGGLLMLTGKRRAGLLVAASGTTLALLDQQETLRAWWAVLPGYLEEVQLILGKVQGTVTDVAAQREKLQRIVSR